VTQDLNSKINFAESLMKEEVIKPVNILQITEIKDPFLDDQQPLDPAPSLPISCHEPEPSPDPTGQDPSPIRLFQQVPEGGASSSSSSLSNHLPPMSYEDK
jgi:hypothetical protein